VEPTEEQDLDAASKDETEKLQYHTVPLRFHATRVPERLSSNPSLLNNHGSNSYSFRKSLSSDLSKTRSRSVSPSLRAETDANSSISSLDTDSDILTDRMGLEELDLDKLRNLDVSSSSLPPVNERLTKDTMEDIHAFSDITKTTGSVSSSSLTSVNERLTKDTMEDVHAFSDITKTTGSVSSSSLTSVNERLTKDTMEDIHAFSDITKTTGSVSSSSLPSVNERLSKDSLEDVHAFSVITKTSGSVSASSSSLPSVNERLSKDSLEDVHAFSDITKTSGSVSSRANSIATGGDVGSLLLETLDECDEFEEDHEEAVVLISNLDEIREEITADLPPLRLNARNVSHLNACNGNVPDKVPASPETRKTRHRRSSSGNIGGNQNRGETSSTTSSITEVDIDILTDRMGLEELDFGSISSDLGAAAPNLQPVTERLSNGTLEDEHAFTDVKSSASSVSRANSIVGDIAFLETLNEVTEECEELELQIISNMENITIED